MYRKRGELKMEWISVNERLPETTPRNDSATVYVIVQDVCGGAPRNHYHVEMTTFTRMNKQYGAYWKVEKGVVKYWKPLDEMPEGFKEISGLAIWENKSWVKEET